MALTSTTADLAEAVLRELGVIDATESPEANDETYVINAYNFKFDELVDRELAYWSKTAIPNQIFIAVRDLIINELVDRELAYWTKTAIPNQIFLSVRDLIINEVRGAFGEPLSAEQKEMQEIIILRQFRRHTQRRASGHATVADYF